MKRIVSCNSILGRVVLLLLVFGVSASASTAPRSPEWQKTLIIAVVGEAQTFDPAVNTTEISSYRYYPNIYESLVQYAPDGTLQPMLAESWEVLDGGLRYRFHLVKNASFSDGTPFDADAVKFAINRYVSVGKGFTEAYTAVKDVIVVDKYTVDILLKERFAPLLAVLGSWYNGIFVSPAAVKAHEVNGDQAQGWLHNHTAGTGPYVLESWVPENSIVLVKNPNYRLGWKPGQLERIVYTTMREPSTIREALEGGTIDMAAEGITPSLIAPLRKAKDIVVASEITHSHFGEWLYLNLDKAPFNNVEVRKALAYAINYDRLVAVWQGTASKADGPFPPTFKPWYSEKSLVRYQYDLEKAKGHLARAGMHVPLNPPLRLDIVWRSGETAERDMAQLIAEDWAKLGIQLNIVEEPRPVWRDAIWKHTFDTAFILIPLRYTDPDSLASLFYHSREYRYRGWNPGYRNPRVDQLIDLARTTTDPAQRVQLYSEFQHIVTDDVAAIQLVNRLDTFAYRREVEGIHWNPNYGPHYQGYEMRKVLPSQ